MSKFRPLWFIALAATAAPATTALASGCSDCRPYVLEETCDADGWGCTVRMQYAPGQSMADDPTGNYWYETPPPDDDYDFEYATSRKPRLGPGGDGWFNRPKERRKPTSN